MLGKAILLAGVRGGIENLFLINNILERPAAVSILKSTHVEVSSGRSWLPGGIWKALVSRPEVSSVSRAS